ncbi:MAG: DUF1592 domain-containing protein [Verrucomicrobiales bacterium]|nr:DUF1592 domain-containing protein [Verrucomicrobiales bacterium]
MKSSLSFLLPFLLTIPVAMAAPKVVLIHGEQYYGSEKSVPALATLLTEKFGYGTTILTSPPDSRALPDLSSLQDADLLVLYIRLRDATKKQLAQLNAYLDAGKPAVALRTTSHGIADQSGWFVSHFGGHFKSHTGQKEACRALVATEVQSHPILAGVPKRFSAGKDGIYHTLPLSDDTTPLVFGNVGQEPAEPLAWTMGHHRFYTSMGSEADFANKAFVSLLLNACQWTLKKAPSTEVETRSFPAPPSHVLASDEETINDWRHWDPSMPPAVIDVDAVADTTSGGPQYREARWNKTDKVMIAQPGYGDVISERSFEDAVFHVDFLLPDRRSTSGVYIDGKWKIQLDTTNQCGAIQGIAKPSAQASGKVGEWQSLQVAVQHVNETAADLSVWLNGKQIHERVRVEEPTVYGFPDESDSDDGPAAAAQFISTEEQGKQCDMGDDFTAVMRFRTEESGPLFSKLSPDGKHREGDKILFIDGGQLHYDIGWVGAIGTEINDRVNNGQWHTVALRHREGHAEIYLDGEKLAEDDDFTAPDNEGSVLRIGAGANDFPDDALHWHGQIASFQFFNEAISDQDVELTGSSQPIERAEPVFEWNENNTDTVEDQPEAGTPLRLQADMGKVRFANVTMRPLAEVDHASILTAWDDNAFKRGEKIYQGICFACHGNLEKAGSLPTSRPFWKDPFKNGKDPHSLYLTMRNGFEQMPPQPWLTPSAAYDVIHYIREEFVKTNNASEYVELTPEYLDRLPKGMSSQGKLTKEQVDYAKGPKYERMNFGPMLDWTYQVAPGNIAYKAIAIRLDDGPGGVSKGRHWMVYDHDTMRVAAAWSGDKFVDWKGIAFDQSHGTHTSIVGEKTLVNPVGPGWANPADGSWADPRFLGRDGKPYGPLPREWTHFKGQYIHGNKIVIKYTVGDAEVLEMPSLVQPGEHPVFARTMNIGQSSKNLHLRVSPADVTAQVVGGTATVAVLDGYQVMTVLAKDTPMKVNVLSTKAEAHSLVIASLLAADPEDLTAYTEGGPAHWTETVTTEAKMGNDEDAFAVDEITYPSENPYHSWMRIGGFDFLPGGNRAAVATWLGDVWLVDDIGGDFKQHRWKRICSGLFQPLGVKWVDGHIYVTCRDQLAKLHDLNGDEEIDYVESFNNDHQVTEHFHEFAMGLQTDDAGNFYYAKSARHAKTALVPHHGTLLRVSKDGSTTEILATGFRAANGVCLNPDGTYIVTDQEGHWNPKNRINYVKEGGFYGNMYGYHDVTDNSDEAMEQPLCWITNAFDRSPGELLWVPKDANWGPMNGKLLNLSYGTGKVFAVPHEKMPDGQAQGGMVSLGLDFPTGIMRGRFHPDNGQLYTTGMFAWAGSKHQDGGFYRIRATGKAMNLPIDLKATPEGIQLGFTNALDREAAAKIESYKIKTWSLKRTKNYGSRHYDEKPLEVAQATVSDDGKSVFLSIPEINTTWCMEVKIQVTDTQGKMVERILHNTIHQLGGTKDQTSAVPGLREKEIMPPKQVEVDHAAQRAHVTDLLEKHCLDCHDASVSKGDLDIETGLTESPLVKSRDLWVNVLERIKNGEMPPEDQPQPTDEERQALVNWIDREVIDFDYTSVKNPGYERARRLSHTEYNNTLRDLFGIDLKPADKFPSDLSGLSGFANSANTLFIQPTLLERYIGAAEEVVTAAMPQWELAKETAPKKLFHTFLRQAYRRPPSNDEVAELFIRYETAKSSGASHQESIPPAVIFALISPNFLYRIENAPTNSEDHQITDLEFASRLSYFLWASTPDNTLLDLADAGTLRDENILSEQLQRMLRDERSHALGHEFASQWLKFEHVGTRVRLDPIDNPWCTDSLMTAMRNESAMFIHSLIEENRPIHNLINANYTYLNQELARHYRIGGVHGDHMRRVTLNDPRRGGIFGQASVLAVTSFPGRTSPVVRGKYILDDVLGTPPPPPPPDAGELDEEVARERELTLKEKLEIHRGSPQCAGCHAKIDPLGFSLENYDWFGRYREEHRDRPIDSEGQLPNGRKFVGLDGLRNVLIERRLDDLTRQLTRKMLSFGLGRQLEYYDELAVQQIHAAVQQDNYRFHTLISEIVNSYPFQWKRLPDTN